MIRQKGRKSVKTDLRLVCTAVLPSQVVDLLDEILDVVAVLAVGPFTTIANAPVLVVNSDRATLGDALLSTPLDRLLEKVSRVCSVIDAQAVVQLLEIDAVLQGAILGKIF